MIHRKPKRPMKSKTILLLFIMALSLMSSGCLNASENGKNTGSQNIDNIDDDTTNDYTSIDTANNDTLANTLDNYTIHDAKEGDLQLNTSTNRNTYAGVSNSLTGVINNHVSTTTANNAVANTTNSIQPIASTLISILNNNTLVRPTSNNAPINDTTPSIINSRTNATNNHIFTTTTNNAVANTTNNTQTYPTSGNTSINDTTVSITSNNTSTSNVGSDSSLSNESYNTWINYNETSASTATSNIDASKVVIKDKNATLESIASFVGEESFVTSIRYNYYNYGSGPHYPSETSKVADTANAGEKASEEASQGAGGTPREVEEADIVKVEGNYMYVLNPYRGLIIIDISKPAEAKVLSKVRLTGYPVEMYIVDYLAIVVLNTNYRYWYNYWQYEDAADSKNIDFRIGSQIVVVNIHDTSNPFVANTFNLIGFASDSRRVGDVVYAVTNTYSWYGYSGWMELKDATFIISIDLANPYKVDIVDKTSFAGSSNQIHATSDTIYVAQPLYKYTNKTYEYYTNVTYVDISDFHGKIKVRGTFSVKGYLEDKYQMDYYNTTFRMVTHFFGGRQGSSKLWIYNVSNHDNITLMGSLLIDDAGNLMATRFAGERAYTIHLPRSIDPLDVVDVSDPTKPKLCDVFEMPGWVTYMEVMGYKILALGVDDSAGQRNVAVSLFDVSDPNNVVMRDRVRIGGKYAWSEANWDPKALSVVDEESLMLVPFSSYDYNTYKSTYGFQVVKYNLTSGDLDAKGSVYGIDSITRTRFHIGYILATSDRTLQVVDTSNLDSPKVVRTVELSTNIIDSIFTGKINVQLVRNWEENVLRLRTLAKDNYDSGKLLDEIEIDARYGSMFVDGDMVCVYGETYNYTTRNGYREYHKWFYVSVYNISTPSDIKYVGTWNSTKNYYYYSIGGYWLGSGDIALLGRSGYYNYNKFKLWIIHCSLDTGAELKCETNITVKATIDSPFVTGHILYFTDVNRSYYYGSYYGSRYYNYNTTYYLGRVDLNDLANPKQLPSLNIPGVAVGVNTNKNIVYTYSRRYNNNSYNLSTLDILEINETKGTCKILSSVKLPDVNCDVRVSNDVAYVLTSSYNYYLYDYHYRYRYDQNSTLIVIDLSNPSLPRLISKEKLIGRYSISSIQGNVIALWSYSSYSLLLLEVNTDDIETLGAYALLTKPVTVRANNGVIDIIMGDYGVMRVKEQVTHETQSDVEPIIMM